MFMKTSTNTMPNQEVTQRRHLSIQGNKDTSLPARMRFGESECPEEYGRFLIFEGGLNAGVGSMCPDSGVTAGAGGFLR